jgi:hypothetical protein
MDMTNQGIDVWALASQDETIDAMMLLSVLPARAATDPRLNREAYYLALEGVTAYGLKEAVKSILQGSLGHGFFPAPPELRMQCNKTMEPHLWERERARRRNQLESERPNPQSAKTQEAKARVSKLYDDFLASTAAVSKDPADFGFRERYGITTEKLAELPDRLSSGDMDRPLFSNKFMN